MSHSSLGVPQVDQPLKFLNTDNFFSISICYSIHHVMFIQWLYHVFQSKFGTPPCQSASTPIRERFEFHIMPSRRTMPRSLQPKILSLCWMMFRVSPPRKGRKRAEATKTRIPLVGLLSKTLAPTFWSQNSRPVQCWKWHGVADSMGNLMDPSCWCQSGLWPF